MASSFGTEYDINQGIEIFSANGKAWLIDVRDEDEYATGHVPGSHNVTIVQLERLYSLVPDRAAPLLLYSGHGSRSGNAVKRLRLMGYTNITNLGGLDRYQGPLE